MKLVVSQYCSMYDESQRDSRDPKLSERRPEFLVAVSGNRRQIESLLNIEMGVLATGHTIEQAVEASAELAYFSAWLGRRGGWVGGSFTGYPGL
jgi:hypothetical protein